MKRIFGFVLVCMFLALPLFAQQDKEKPKADEMSMMPPGPLDNEFFAAIIGEWEGNGTSPMGKSKDWQKIDWSLDKQFIAINYSMKMSEFNEVAMKEMAAQMKMSDKDVKDMMMKEYKGMGQFTLNPMNGDFMGSWFDNMRGVYHGNGKIEGKKMTSTWEGPRGKSVRTMEQVGNDKLVETWKETDPMGNVMEGSCEWTRKK